MDDLSHSAEKERGGEEVFSNFSVLDSNEEVAWITEGKQRNSFLLLHVFT